MNVSQSSRPMIGALSDVLAALDAHVTRLTRLEAAGDWALAFPALDRLKFVAVLRGTCWLMLPDRDPQPMSKGDVCLIGRTGYAVASNPTLPPVDGARLFDELGSDVLRLGGNDTVMLGGGVTFAPGNPVFLLDMLPAFLLVPGRSDGAGAVANILALLNDEAERADLGNELVSARLADVLLIEAIRVHAGNADATGVGWLGALTDRRIGRALQSIHADIAQPWTTARLAGIAGMSRAAFCAEFARRVGKAPLSYVRAWRLTLARAALARGGSDVARVAAEVGYTSQSAFGHAFRRAFGTSPKSSTRP
ncbi:AraC family transcriptional regulator [Bradyrhizobium sp. AUGA SZCCT0042]|nr:AraC family transcriptional regulator [Bradyrhizobium sp. AUGA SZCCT0042]MBR1224415.1 AraC family transcriptional regulator [Bradyrhizobium sp. AUGA SZCCT0176]MBR1297918.1 AraC family transcriptional regulator [Bradyrhizobium sp. AUGA SZCCT0042]